MVQFPWWDQILELCRQCGVEDIDTSTLLVGQMMTERKECLQNHLAVQLQRDKGSTLFALQGIDIGCCHVNEKKSMLNWVMPWCLKASAMGWVLQWASGTPQTLMRTVNKQSSSAFFSSTGDRAMTVDVVPVVPLLELNFDKCQSDKRQFFTEN